MSLSVRHLGLAAFCLVSALLTVFPCAARIPVASGTAAESFTIIERSDNFRLHISFPSTGNALADAELEIWARRQASIFTRGVEDLPASFPFELAISYRLLRPSPNAVSVVFLITTFMGGDQPEPGLMTFTYDTRDGRRLSLMDIFRQGDGLLRFLSRYTSERLAAELGGNHNPAMLASGTRPDPSNFDLYSLEATGLVIHFPPYQVAPLSEGYLEVRVPLDVLAEFQPDLSLWGRDGAKR